MKRPISIGDLGPLHRQLIDAYKDQLIIVLLNRLGTPVSIPVAEVDATGEFAVLMNVKDGAFNFTVVRKSEGIDVD